MSREKEMRKVVVRILRPLGAFAVENGVGVGTPDVAYCDGWLELKSISYWPARESTPLRVPSFTPEQRLWHRSWSAAGGRSHVLLKVEHDWLLLGGCQAAEHLGEVPKGTLFMIAEVGWEGWLDTDHLIRHLRDLGCSRRT